MKTEFEIVKEFSHQLDLPNKTDGTLFIYKSDKNVPKKPDGYYYYEGITFILDAKAEGEKFSGQLESYMDLEPNDNFVGFKYNGVDFECYVKGVLQRDETKLYDKTYYKQKYFPQKINNEDIVEKSAKKLANLFRNSKIDKQMNVPFIGAAMICMRHKEEIDLTSTTTILRSITIGVEKLIKDSPLPRKQKKDFIKMALSDPTLKCANDLDLFNIVSEISTIYHFIDISMGDNTGHDIMNSFLRIFRKWNSANANERGEVFTPDHIAQLMYTISDCSKDNTILDPTCGSGTFLTNSMALMQAETTDHQEQKRIQENQIIGIETIPFNATLAGINMMLHGDGASNIYQADCFEKLPSLKDVYDRVLMNPPFSQKDIELKFVKKALDYMKEGGVLSCILPKSCVKGTIDKNLEYMEDIFKISKLQSVISLPNSLFYPNATPATCIIVLKKDINGHSGETLLIDLSDDGFLAGNDCRTDTGKWTSILQEVLNAYKGIYTEYRAIKKQLKYTDELLFERYASKRTLEVEKETFDKYLREKIASKILCGQQFVPETREFTQKLTCQTFSEFPISSLLKKIEKGKEIKSINRKLENKYQGIYPLIVAKKDNNGVGGMVNEPRKIYMDKFCIISGGDGGGGKTYYCDFGFAATNFVMICDLQESYQNLADKYAKFYLSVVISERLYTTIGHGRTISDVPKDIVVKLPVKEDKTINWEYMSDYVKNLQYAQCL